jgi:hypothetical protein
MPVLRTTGAQIGTIEPPKSPDLYQPVARMRLVGHCSMPLIAALTTK